MQKAYKVNDAILLFQNGSPVEHFVRMQERPSRAKAANFVTETPGPTRSKRRILGELTGNSIGESYSSKTSRKTPARISTDYPGKSILTTPKPSNFLSDNKSTQKRLKCNRSLKASMETRAKEDTLESNELETSTAMQSQTTPPKVASQTVTGDLVRACCIM